MPLFIPPQLCRAVAQPPAGDGWIHEAKIDGYRMQLNTEGPAPVLRTRQGLDWTQRFKATADAAAGLPPAIIDGELTALDKHGAPDFPGFQAAMAEGRSDDMVFFAFDLLFDGEQDLRPLPLLARKERLEVILSDKQLRATRRIRYLEHLTGPGHAILESARRLNLEGIVSKRADAPYVSARADTWQKCKCRTAHEVVIGGWSGKGKLRSLLVGVYRDGHLVHAGRVGTGFNRFNAGPLLERLQALATPTSPFRGTLRKASDVTWVRPELVAEIEFAGWTDTGMVRQAAFKRLAKVTPSKLKKQRPA